MVFEALALVYGVVELCVGVGDFFAVDEELEALYEAGFTAMLFGQGRHFYGVVGEEGWLDEVFFDFFAKDFVYEFAFAHGGVHFYVERFTRLPQGIFIHFTDIYACVFFDGFEHADALVGAGEVDGLLTHLHFGAAGNFTGYAFEAFFDHVHHPDVIFVGHVNFHGGKLGVVGTVHAFVAEHFSELIDAVEASDDESFEVEFVGDSQIEGNVEGIVMRFKGAGCCAAVDGLEDGCFHFEPAMFVEVAAHGLYEFAALFEDFADFGIDDEVHIALAVAEFGVGEGIVNIAFFIAFDDGEGAQSFAEEFELIDMYGGFSGFGFKNPAFYADDVAEVEQFFEEGVVEGFVFARADFIAVDVELDAAGFVLQYGEGGLAHDASCHEPAGEADFLKVVFFRIVLLENFFGMGVYIPAFGRVGVDAELNDFLQVFPAHDFLFA